ncbi:MFS transporter [Desulfovibrio inopinatus]|uniref:MFS transporter n=1 Tax=Desulfovibrio inopinatus TaxID=102109 RepID=UPI0004167843|nr:MFS transporter [Desulfovibrio inopinatus]
MNLKNRMYLYLFILTVATAFGFQGWRTLYNNFAVEIAHISGQEMGIIQSIREVPGLLTFFIVYLLLTISEHKLAALSVAFMGIGISLVGFMPSFYGIVFTTLIISFGIHSYLALNQSLTLQYFDLRQAPIVLGRLRGVNAIVNIFVGAIIFCVSDYMSYTNMFIWIGVIVILGGLFGTFLHPKNVNATVQHKKMVLKRKYWLYYILTFLSGARRQIFVAFAVFLLVIKFKFTIQEVTVLFIVNNIVAMFANPLIGKAVNALGERKVLSVEYLSLIVVFLVYAYSDSKWLVILMYIVDHLVFNFSLAINTFFQKIGDKEDIASSMAVGGTINHIAAVIIPVLGGLAWTFHPSWIFVGGAMLSVCSLLFVQFIPYEYAKHQQREIA